MSVTLDLVTTLKVSLIYEDRGFSADCSYKRYRFTARGTTAETALTNLITNITKRFPDASLN